jgi:CubicO group peptidase (beta-lactamase class C family)
MVSVQFPALDGVLPDYGRFSPLDWGLGVELKGDKDGHWSGSLTSPRTFGHFGGSGTFLWVDPERAVACAALTTRGFGQWAKDAWPRFSDAVVEELG